MKEDLFVALAETTEQLMAQRSVNFDSAFIMCNEMLTEITDGAIIIDPEKVADIIAELRTRLHIVENKGGAR